MRALEVSTVTPEQGELLRAIRTSLGDAEEALLCVAFVSEAGVHLLRKELEGLGDRARLLTTTVFGSTSPVALDELCGHGIDVRVLNPGGSSTYHPKVYLGRGARDRASVVIGSCNMTAGLAANHEAATWLRGRVDDDPIRAAWRWAEARWDDSDTRVWTPGRAPEATTATFADDFYGDLARVLSAEGNVFHTLGRDPRPNTVTEYTPEALYVRTAASDQKGRGPQQIPAWMFNLAWDYLRTHGELSNKFLLGELRVHRSSAVCAILARMPGVECVPGLNIVLRWARGKK